MKGPAHPGSFVGINVIELLPAVKFVNQFHSNVTFQRMLITEISMKTGASRHCRLHRSQAGKPTRPC
jgi:hypothetical protein